MGQWGRWEAVFVAVLWAYGNEGWKKGCQVQGRHRQKVRQGPRINRIKEGKGNKMGQNK